MKTLSRSTEIDIEKCVKNADNNRFNLVLMAAARAREIRRNNTHSNRQEHIHATTTALLEYQEGKYGNEYIRKVR